MTEVSEKHRSELYYLEMYGGRSEKDEKTFCDLIVVDPSTRFSRKIYLASIIGTEKECQKIGHMLNESRNGRICRADKEPTDERPIAMNVYANAKKYRYDEFSMKIDDLHHFLYIDKSARPNTKERSDWQQEEDRRLEAGQSPRHLPSELAELVLAWDGNMQEQLFRILWDRYNTPMLDDEHWKQYILDTLLERQHFLPLDVYSFGNQTSLEAGLLRLTEKQLENIITEGIVSLELEFAELEDDNIEDVLSNLEGLEDYLTHFAGDLGERIQENVDIRFDPTRDRHHELFTEANTHANKQGLTGLFPPQADAVMSIAKTLQDDKYCFMIGEMG